MKYIFGPVPSRRLGRSLGVDPIPLKTCNYQCIYCQLGRTTNFTNERKNYIPKDQICMELELAVELSEKNMDFVTFVGSGEPTLYKDLKELILKAKELTKKPICVITNGSLLKEPDVRDALFNADLIIPSFDAGDNDLFIKINRPHPKLSFNQIIKGLVDFKKEYSGKLWIEIMLIKDINDSRKELLKIKEKIDFIRPDRIDINVPIRPPTETWVAIPTKRVKSILTEIFDEYIDLNVLENGLFQIYSSNFEKEVLSIIQRHPMREDQIIKTFTSANLSKDIIVLKLKELESEKRIKNWKYIGKSYWKLNFN